MKSDNYISICAEISAMESNILDRVDIERMINATDYAKAFQVLNDTDLGSNLLGIEPEKYRDALAKDMHRLHNYLQRNLPDNNLYKLLMLQNQFTVLKILFKSKFFGVNAENLINSIFIRDLKKEKNDILGNRVNSSEELKQFIDSQKGQIIDVEIKEAILFTLKKINNNTKPDEIDALLTQKYYDLAIKYSRKIGNSTICRYTTACIDSANILTYIRARRLKIDKNAFKNKIIIGGNIDLIRFIKAYPDDPATLLPFVKANFDKHVADAYGLFCDNNKIFQFERVVENYRSLYFKNSQLKPYGPDVVYSYYLLKKNANTNCNIILTGKMNHVPVDEIRKSLRGNY